MEGEKGATTDEPSQYDYHTDKSFTRTKPISVTLSRPHHDEASPLSEDTAISHGLHPHSQHRAAFRRAASFDQPESIDDPVKDLEDRDREPTLRVPVHDQRTVHIANLPERATHKDLVGIIRGGRLLDIFIRNDRSATVSFVEGAADFLVHAKRNDIYLHTKRVS